jgi:hypothetical protein
MDSIRNWLKEAMLGLLAIFAGLFFYERNRANEAEAIADNQKTLEKANELTSKVASNDGAIQAEAEKQKEEQKKVDDEKANTTGNADFFNKRKSD